MEVFHEYRAVPLNNLQRLFVLEIVPLVENVFVNLCEPGYRFAPPV
jgi:hypothetical protein